MDVGLVPCMEPSEMQNSDKQTKKTLIAPIEFLDSIKMGILLDGEFWYSSYGKSNLLHFWHAFCIKISIFLENEWFW